MHNTATVATAVAISTVADIAEKAQIIPYWLALLIASSLAIYAGYKIRKGLLK